MEHLTLEELARLVDEPAAPDEAEHLRGCLVCRREMEAMRAQTAALAGLPELEPGPGAWRALEAALAAESLVSPQPVRLHPVRRFRTAHPYLRAAAAVLLLVTGIAAGTSLLRPGSSDPVATAPVTKTTEPGSVLQDTNSDRPLGLAQLPVPGPTAPVAEAADRDVPVADVPAEVPPLTGRRTP
ncbi:MAG TPA: hypothetical protein VGB66_05705, partial [Longimicrobium sp.]